MIGGTDVILENPGIPPSEVLDALVRRLFERWRHALLQDGESGTCYTSYVKIPFGRLHEIFVFRDQAAFASWEQLGADPSNTNSMIHVIADEREITMIVDDIADAEMKSILHQTRQLLDFGIGWGRAA